MPILVAFVSTSFFTEALSQWLFLLSGLQVSKFSSDPRQCFKREAYCSWAKNDPPDEPLYLMYYEEP